MPHLCLGMSHSSVWVQRHSPLSVNPSPTQPFQGSATGRGRGLDLPPHPPFQPGVQVSNNRTRATQQRWNPFGGAWGPSSKARRASGEGCSPWQTCCVAWGLGGCQEGQGEPRRGRHERGSLSPAGGASEPAAEGDQEASEAEPVGQGRWWQGGVWRQGRHGHHPVGD